MPMAINFGRVGIYNKEFPAIKSPDPLITFLAAGSLLPLTVKATKLGKVVTYYKKLQPIKSQNPLNTWPSKVTW